MSTKAASAALILEPRSNTAEAEKIGFLNPKEELFVIGVPWVAAIATIVLWILGRMGIEREVTDVPILISTLIFFDSIHVLFTFVLWASSPELRSWTAADSARATRGWAKGMGPWARTFSIAAALGIIFWFIKGSSHYAALRGMATTWLFLDLLGPAHHTLSQMRGLSFCYNSSIRKSFRLSDAEQIIARQCERFEKLFFNLLLAGEIAYWIPEIFDADKYQIPGIDSVQFVGGVLVIASTAAILVNGLYFPRQEKTHKSAFLFRVVLFPLKILSIIGGIGIRAAHGTEYLFVFRRMLQGSKITKAKRSRVYMITIAASLIYAVPFILTWTDATNELVGWSVSDALLAWALGLTFIVRFTHYYMDAVLFRMSDPATRAAVAPLLSGRPSV